jgi:hypothetical protein
MTVGELIEKLRQLDPTLKVVTCGSPNDDYREARTIQILGPDTAGLFDELRVREVVEIV